MKPVFHEPSASNCYVTITDCSHVSLDIFLSEWGAFLRWWPLSTIVGGSFNLFLATTGDVWIIPSFRIWDYVMHVEHVSCVITNCGQHQWVIPSLWALLEENTSRKLLSLSLDLFFKILLFQVAFLILGLYGLHGPRCLLSPKRPLNLITHSLIRMALRLMI